MNVRQFLYEAEYRIIGADPRNAQPHHDNSVEIIQTWSDGGFFIVKNNIFPIKPGALFLINATNTHYSNPSNPAKYNRSKVIVSNDFFRQITQLCGLKDFFERQLLSTGGTALYFPPSGAAAQRMDQLLSSVKETDLNSPFAQIHIASALVQILEEAACNPVQAAEDNDLHSIDLLARYINAHMNNWDDIRMADIAEALHISQSRASHLFKALCGKCLTQYSTDLRIAEAKKLLLTTQMKIMDISDTLKFQNPTIFCKYFKKYAGCTPRQYRESSGISTKNS